MMQLFIFLSSLFLTCLAFGKGGGYATSADVQVVSGWNEEIRIRNIKSIEAKTANCVLVLSDGHKDLYNCSVTFRVNRKKLICTDLNYVLWAGRSVLATSSSYIAKFNKCSAMIAEELRK